MMQSNNNIVPFGTKSERQRVRQLADQISNLDYSDSNHVPCLVMDAGDGEGLFIYNENHLPWLGGYHRACLFDLNAVDSMAGKAYVKYAGQFVEPLRALVG